MTAAFQHSRRPGTLRYSVALLGVVTVAGCTGTISNGGDESSPKIGGGASPGGDKSSPGSVGTPGDTTPPGSNVTTEACTTVTAPTLGRTPLRRLTNEEYNNTIRDLLADTSRPADAFPPDVSIDGFTTNAEGQAVQPAVAEGYLTASENLAARAVQDLKKLLACDAATTGESACARQFISTFGRRAFRRPLTATETSDRTALYDKLRAGDTFAGALQGVVESFLQSPHFLYRRELGRGTAIDGAKELTPHETASRLSYLLWGSLPDAELDRAANADALRTEAQIATQARRMLADAKVRPWARSFFAQWLGLTQAQAISKDAAVYPKFTPAVRDAMVAETEAFIDHVMWTASGSLQTLLTSDLAFVNPTLAGFYGVTAPSGTQLQSVPMGDKRAGILTHGSLMAIMAKANQTAPVKRGEFVRTHVLCQHVPPPPPSVNAATPDPKPGVSTRERFEQHATDPACAACHSLMDPIGFGFENFAGDGRYRDADQGLPVDASGVLVSTRDIDGAFDGPAALTGKLATSSEVRDCVARQWFRYGFGRVESQEDACTMRRLFDSFEAAKGDLRELLVAFTTTDAFRYVRPTASAGGAP